LEILLMNFRESRINAKLPDAMNPGILAAVHLAERLSSPGQLRSLHSSFRGPQSQVLISDFQTNLVQIATLAINCSADPRNAVGKISERVSALILDGLA
jgi:hypothetical protein